MVRWGLGDVVWVWLAGILGAIVAGSVAAAVRGTGPSHATDATDIAVTVIGQGVGMLGAAWLVSQGKGLGSLRRDFGLVVRIRDWPWLAAGVLLQVAALGAVELLQRASGDQSSAQETVRVLERSSGPEMLVAILGVALLAPLVEELLFRGLLLRALLRRMDAAPAVAISGVLFAAAHLLDPGAAIVLAPLLALGIISGTRAVRTGDLSQSILLHAGFNLLAAAQLLVL